MPEIRIDLDSEALAVMDGFIQASGSNRTKIIGELIKRWSDDKLHESIIVCRMARINPLAVDSNRQALGDSKCGSAQT